VLDQPLDQSALYEDSNQRGEAGRHRLRGLVQPCLLLLLSQGPAHGYGLSEQIGRLACYSGEVSPSIVYRCLRGMEREALVRATWDSHSLGPARRVYELTEAGRSRLREWTGEMRKLKAEAELFIRAADGQDVDGLSYRPE
jgi:PadR family transcriptional regulator, regulatory protein PadR